MPDIQFYQYRNLEMDCGKKEKKNAVTISKDYFR
jgi:hypothetical protein